MFTNVLFIVKTKLVNIYVNFIVKLIEFREISQFNGSEA